MCCELRVASYAIGVACFEVRVSRHDSRLIYMALSVPADDSALIVRRNKIDSIPFLIPHSEFAFPNSEFRIPNSDFALLNSAFRIPTSHFQTLSSVIRPLWSVRTPCAMLYALCRFPTLSRLSSSKAAFRLPTSKLCHLSAAKQIPDISFQPISILSPFWM